MKLSTVALKDIACTSQTDDLLWWQIRAREALAAIREALAEPVTISCDCGDMYERNSFGGKFIQQYGCCPNCDAAEPVKQEHSEQYWLHEINNARAEGYEKGRASCKHDERMLELGVPVQPVKQEPVMDYEYICALREGEQHQAEDSYFFVRPENDTPTSRKMFCQGFERGFHKGLKYAAPVSAKREWVDLTDEEIATVVHEMNGNEPTSPFWRDLIYEAIAAFKEKNK